MLRFDKPYRILLIDEDQITVKLLESSLNKMGAICETYTGSALLDVLKQKETYDILLMRVSVKDTYSHSPLIDKIVNELQLKFPIVGLTSDNEEAAILKLKRAGFYDVLVLPPTPQSLFERIALNIEHFNAHNSVDYNEIDEFLSINYMDNIAALTKPQLEGWRKLLDFTKNDINYANKIIGMTFFGIVDDMRLLRRKVIKKNWSEAIAVLLELNKTLKILSEEGFRPQIEALLASLSSIKTDYQNIVGLYNLLHEKLLGWAVLAYPKFNTKHFNSLLITTENYETTSQQSLKNVIQAPTIAENPTAGIKDTKPKKGNVLIIDDDETISHIIDFRLKKEGYQTRICMDGKAAIDTLSVDEYNLIITDLMLPYYNGLEIINIIRNNLKLTTPILVLSSVENEKTVVEALRMGANDYINKPFSPQELTTRINKYL